MKPQIFLRDYSEQEKEEFSHLLQSSIANLPFTLSSPIAKLAEQVTVGNYNRAMIYALDFFEVSVQYLSCMLIVLLQKEDENDKTKHEALVRVINKIDAKRPLSFGDWINDIYFPLLKAAKDRLPDNKLVRSLNQNLVNSGCNVLIGGKKDASIVQIRNEYKGHGMMLAEEIYKGVVYTIEPRIFMMLKAIEPLQEWKFFSCIAQIDHNRFEINDLKGIAGEQKEVETSEQLAPYHYYVQMDAHTDGLIDLFPLVFSNEKNYVYVFQSLKDEYISYISSNEKAVTYIDDRWNEQFDACLQKTLPAFDISKELNWEQIREITDQASRMFLEHAYKEKKYNQELFVDRAKLSVFFDEFKESDKTLLPLLGEAGQGKTNQLCYWTEKQIKEREGVLIFNSSGFSEHTLEEKLKRVFGYGIRKPIKKLLDSVHRNAVANNQKMYFFFDAINECLNYKGGENQTQGPLYLYRDIRDLLVNESYTHFKVLFTCRNYTWKNLIQSDVPSNDPFSFVAADDEEIAVRGFTHQELEKAYEIYKNLYQMETPFEVLKKGVLIRLQDPLVLKIACTNYLSMEFPAQMPSYTSISLFDKMLQDISNSYAGNKQCLIVRELASHILQEYERGLAVDSISEVQLRKAYNDKHSKFYRIAQLIYKEEEVSVAYGELLNKPERPILRLVENDNGEGQIQFIYERFLEFMLALAFTEREQQKLQEPTAPISAEVYVKALKESNTNVVFMGAMRNALMMDYRRTQDLSVLIRLAEKYGKNYEVMLLITEVLNVLIQENYETEIFTLIHRLLDTQPAEGIQLIDRFNAVEKKIESNQADDEVISLHNRLSEQLSPTIRLRELASVSTVNGIFLSDYFNENLYTEDPYSLLWKLINDPINDVRNDACLYLYYLSNKAHTNNYSPLRENLTLRIVQEMYRIIKGTPIPVIILQQKTRKEMVVLLETAVRLTTLLIIDTLMDKQESDTQLVRTLLGEIRQVVKHFTANFYLLRVMMPFFRIMLRRQITFQAIYVNNAIEYQTFWDDNIVAQRSDVAGEWTREKLRDVLDFLFHYQRYYKKGRSESIERMPDFAEHQAKILSAYTKADGLSYFALERILVIMGTCSWEYIRPIVVEFFTDKYRQNEWFDYSRMSMLYVLFQVVANSEDINREIIALYGREAEDWTRLCKGQFKAHNSHKANPTQHYKRNVMNWYCVVYCRHIGDGAVLDGDQRSVPIFYKLLDEAIEQKDKELLYHLIENISELITDYGYIQTALSLLKHILSKLDSVEKVEEINGIQLDRSGVYQDDITTLVGKVLGTAKNCFPVEVDSFIKKDLVGMKFPGIAKFSAEILNFNPSGEKLSDLFTHKFGNFLMWSLLNEEAVGQFAHESMSIAAQSPDFIKWFDKVIRILFKHLFEIKL